MRTPPTSLQRGRTRGNTSAAPPRTRRPPSSALNESEADRFAFAGAQRRLRDPRPQWLRKLLAFHPRRQNSTAPFGVNCRRHKRTAWKDLRWTFPSTARGCERLTRC